MNISNFWKIEKLNLISLNFVLIDSIIIKFLDLILFQNKFFLII